MSRRSFLRWVFIHPSDPALTEATPWGRDGDPVVDGRFVGCVRDNAIYPKMVRKGLPLWELADGVTVVGRQLTVPFDHNDTCNAACKRARSPRWMCGCRGCQGNNHGRELSLHLDEVQEVVNEP